MVLKGRLQVSQMPQEMNDINCYRALGRDFVENMSKICSNMVGSKYPWFMMQASDHSEYNNCKWEVVCYYEKTDPKEK